MLNIKKALDEFKKKDLKITILEEIKSGKEATVFKAECEGKIYALKIYKDNLHMSFNRYNIYMAGKHFSSYSSRKAVAKKTVYGRGIIEEFRTRREFKMMEKFIEFDANIPKVYEFTSNAILMEYIGDKNKAAPKIKDVALTTDQAQQVYENIMQSVEIFWNNGVVHGDLSEFNILWWKEKAYIIDFPQAIDVRQNPNAEELLERDILNVKNFFRKYIDIPN
jgi:RIO kinase 1